MTQTMKSLLHIGMPKCMSTSVQAYLREAADVYFAGIGPSKFVERDMLMAFQRQILRTGTPFYDREGVAAVFDRAITRAATEKAKLFAFSDESIPFPLSFGRANVSYMERLLRLKEVMPEGTEVLMIVRRPLDFLKSAYKYRCVMNGVNHSFEEWLKRLILQGDTHWLSTIKVFHYAEAARHIFGTVRVIAMEDIRADPDVLISYLQEMGADGPDSLPRENVGMANDKFANFRDLTATTGNTWIDDDFNMISPAERFLCQADIAYFGSVFAGMLAKEQTLGAMRNLAAQLPARRAEPCFDISDATRARLADYVAQSNAALKAHYGVDTDALKYGEF